MIPGATADAVAVPESATVIVGFTGSLLVIVTLPESVPTAVGLNVTPKFTFPPGATVLGVVIPETPKGAPLTVTNEIVRFAPPEFDMLSALLSVVPTFALPKFRFVVLTLICCGAAVPVPANETCVETDPSLLCNVSVPLALPAAEGSNHT